MFKRILLAYDGSVSGQKALLDCREIAQLAQAEIFLVAVMLPPTVAAAGEAFVFDDRQDQVEMERYRKILDEGIARLKEAGYAASGEVVTGDPTDQIARQAEKTGADLIVVGHKHLGSWAARWWRGSVSKSLIERAPCSVLVAITR
jgi:nucleotide-binding universal stress UspA family protein